MFASFQLAFLLKFVQCGFIFIKRQQYGDLFFRSDKSTGSFKKINTTLKFNSDMELFLTPDMMEPLGVNSDPTS